MGALTVADGFRVLKLLAEQMLVQYEGYGLPNGSPEAKERYANAATIRKAFNLLWAQVEQMAAKPTEQKTFTRELMEAHLAGGPVQYTTEVETL